MVFSITGHIELLRLATVPFSISSPWPFLCTLRGQWSDTIISCLQIGSTYLNILWTPERTECRKPPPFLSGTVTDRSDDGDAINVPN